MKSTANEANVEAPQTSNRVATTPKHLSDPMPVRGLIVGWFAPKLGRTLRVQVGKIAVFRGPSGEWGPYLKTGQVIVVENSPSYKLTARVERFLEQHRVSSRYYRGPVKPLSNHYVVVVTKIETRE